MRVKFEAAVVVTDAGGGRAKNEKNATSNQQERALQKLRSVPVPVIAEA